MHHTLKVVIGVAVGFTVGFSGGYMVVRQGRALLKEQAKRATTRAEGTRVACRKEAAQLKARLGRTTTALALARAREDLLWALRELNAKNYGNASTRLAKAREQIKAATRALPAKQKARASGLFEKTAQAQTLVMQLDKMADVFIEELLSGLDKLTP